MRSRLHLTRAEETSSRSQLSTDRSEPNGCRGWQPVEQPLESRRARSIGLATAAIIAFMLALPVLRSKRSHGGSDPADERGIEIVPRRESADPKAALVSLTEVVGALVQLEHARQRSEKAPARRKKHNEAASLAWLDRPVPELPTASEFTSATACMASYLPETELPEGALDFVCSESEFWSIEQRAYQRIVHRKGEGARLWKKLGAYTLAALATMRKGCCQRAEPLLAVVPGLWCGILRDSLRAFGPSATRTPFVEFERTMTCLSARGVRLPERWGKSPSDDGRQAFRRLTMIAQQRGHDIR